MLTANNIFCCKIVLLFVCSFVSTRSGHLLFKLPIHILKQNTQTEKQADSKLKTINKKPPARQRQAQLSQLSLPAEGQESSTGQFPEPGQTYY